MRRKKSNLGEMQEQELLKVEHKGCWIAFWGLLAAIIIQSILFGSQDCKTLAGEGIVFIVLSIYIAVACVRRGIWDRRFQMKAKTNLILSTAAALVTGGVMLDKNKLIESVEECLGWPYVSPGTNDSRGIDCSGLFVKAYRDQGTSIYHGSNTIYRKYCSEKGMLISVTQLQPGMAVFKWNPNTPAKFADGQGDFQHIGLVCSVNPLRIVHASSAAGCVTTDTKLGKRAFWGLLKDVAKDAAPTTPEKGGETLSSFACASVIGTGNTVSWVSS